MKTLITVLGIVTLVAVIALLLTYPLMFAINYVFSGPLLTLLFGSVHISFWKTFVLTLIITTLFKSYKN